MRKLAFLITLTLYLAFLAGCFTRDLARVAIDNQVEETVWFPVAVNNDLDVLFVIDTSGSMQDEQSSLRASFGRLIEQITTIEHGLPSLHIGVVTTDIGIGATYARTVQGCSAQGDGAVLQKPACLDSGQRFLVDVASGGGRETNYSGTIESAFSCMADLGIAGCGFEQPLEAMRRALDTTMTPENAGFLRDHARLAIVFITDEDDCSASSAELFNPDESLLGPRQQGYRCFEYGVTCDVANPRSEGEHPSCRPRQKSPLLHDIAEYVAFVGQLERDPSRDILVAGIVGDNVDPVLVDRVTIDGKSMLAVRKSCGAEAGPENGAMPPIRLRGFLEAFTFHSQSTICDSDLGDSLEKLGEFMRPPLTHACLPDSLLDIDSAASFTQLECKISELRPAEPRTYTEALLPACDNPDDPTRSSELPCHTVHPDAGRCGHTERTLILEAHYDPALPAPPGTTVEAHCAAK